MASGYGAGAFGAGFAQSLTNVLLGHRQQVAAKEDRDFEATLPLFVNLAQQDGDWSRVENLITTHNPKLAAKLKKNSPFAHLSELMGPQVKMSAQQPAMSQGTSQPQTGLGGLPLPQPEPAPPGSGLAPAGGQPPLAPLPSRTVNTEPIPGTSAPPAGSTFFGSPVLTPTQRAQQHAEGVVAENKLVIDARRKIATQLGMPPDKANDYALYGTRPPQRTGAAGYQAIAVEVPDGKGGWTQTYGTYNRGTGKFEDPDTGEELKDARRPTTSASSSLGQYVEQAARVLGFPNANAAAQAGKMNEVETKAHELAQQQAGATTTGRTEAEAKAPLSTQGKYNLLLKLQEDWNKLNQPQREMERQFQLMQTGLERATADPIGGSQAVLVTFQKILDPSSVVRESEYSRSPEGLSLVDRLQGLYDRYSKGGAGVPVPVLKEMVETARQFMAGQQNWNALAKDSIAGTATDAGLNPDRVFGVADASANPAGKPGAAGAGAAGGAAAGKPYKDANGNWIIP